MLNYIWLALIVTGIGVALYGDIGDLSSNRYHNGEAVAVVITPSAGADVPFKPNSRYSCTITVDRSAQSGIFGADTGIASQKCELVTASEHEGALHIFADEQTPLLWKEVLKGLRNPEYLSGKVAWQRAESGTITAKLRLDDVRFVNMNAVTNDGIIRYAKTAVELAIGLIGIMALWLGIMKIAEQAGLIAGLARLLKPVTTRVFPDVPADHPAMGSMIMNISANMLGLSNAATPFGLKAMEELNKLNKKAGTATDAMCTFLIINTSNVQLIPATVIAIRAASGSANPAEILGPVLLATFITLVLGVTIAKILARLPFFRKQLEVRG
jgi:spore maturation protein A